jgi:hypothetical protein
MSAIAIASPSIRAEREARARRARTDAQARLRSRAEALVLFALTAAVLTLLGARTTSHLHLVYPDALTRLDHAFIAWWNVPPRFRAVGFIYPPLQTVALLPFALVRPLATSLLALPLFSALCAGAVVATLDQTLIMFGVRWWMRWPLLAAFALNPVFLDYGANGTATCLVMALLAAGLHNFCAWYRNGGDSVRSLGMCGFWLSIAFLARYETILWLVAIAAIVAIVRLARGARLIEVVAQEAILLSPVVYIFLIWSGISALVGGGGVLSWITRAGGERVAGLTYNGHSSTASRIGSIADVLWRTSPLMLIVPGLLILAAVLLRRPILLAVAGLALVGAGVAALRMVLLPNPILLQPGYEMVALVPMLIGAGWLISLFGAQGSTARAAGAQLGRTVTAGLMVLGLAAGVFSGYDLMKADGNVYDQAFTIALSSHLGRITPAHGRPAPDSPAAIYADQQGLSTFLEAAVDGPKTVLTDDVAFPNVTLDNDSVTPFRTRAELGDAGFTRLLDQPVKLGKVQYLVVGNPDATVPGYPKDLVAARYPAAYSGHMPHTAVVYRNPLVAVVELNPPPATPVFKGLPSSYRVLLELYQRLPSLSPVMRHKGAI